MTSMIFTLFSNFKVYKHKTHKNNRETDPTFEAALVPFETKDRYLMKKIFLYFYINMNNTKNISSLNRYTFFLHVKCKTVKMCC